MKKLVSLILAGVLGAALMTGCGGQSTEQSADNGASTGTTTESTASGTVSMNGSTSMKKLVEAACETFNAQYPSIKAEGQFTGSGAGLEAVANGTADIGNSSRALTDEEKAKGLVENIVAIDGIAVVVDNANTVTSLTKQQLADIYTGKITNWSEVGGNDEEIVLIGREAGSGTRDGFESITGTEDACQYRQELTSTGDVITTVSQNPSAIGYASLASISDSVKAITVEGIEATEDTVRDGSYKIQRPFVLVTKEGEELSPQAQAFYDYAMSSDVADLIAQAGAVAIH